MMPKTTGDKLHAIAKTRSVRFYADRVSEQLADETLRQNRRESFFMLLPVLRTERMLLRPWMREDVDALHALWTEPDMRRYLWDDIVIRRETAERAVESHLETADQHGIGYWVLHIPPPISEDGAPIAGFCGFRFVDDGPEIELMYGLQAEHWGGGLATEACHAALEYLWRSTSHQRVYARTDPPNYRSVRVMQRLSMKHASTTETTITYMLRRPA